MTLYGKRTTRTTANVYYIGINPMNGKTVCVLSGGHLNHDGWFQIFAANAGRWLMNVHDVHELNELPKADYYYVCC